MTTKISADNLKADIAITTTGDIDVSSGTLTLANDQISGDKISGGTISTFASTGIDDNATSTAITIDSSQRIGLNTTTPGAKLEIDSTGSYYNTANQHQQWSYNGTPFLSLYMDAYASPYFDTDSASGWNPGATMVWKRQGSEKMRIDSSGQIGIGTSSPSAKLEISASTPDIQLTDSDGTNQFATIKQDGSNLKILSRNNTGSGGILLKRNVGGTETDAFQIQAGGDISFYDSTGASQDLFWDASTSRLGIGTSLPDAMLHIHDDGASTSTHVYTKLHIENDDHSALQFSGIGEQWIWFSDDTTATPVGGITYYHGGQYMAFRAEGSERMRINSSGNVGIGTTSPKEKLDSRGSAVFSGDHATATNAYGTSHGILLSSTPNLGRITAVSNGANDVKLELRGLDGGSANSNQLVLDGGTSNVGIGISSPTSKLEIYSTATYNARTSGINIHRPGSYGQYASISYNGGSTYFSSTYTGAGAGVYGDFKWQAYDSTSTPVERMRISSSGNVGINTSSPSSTLDVNGSIRGNLELAPGKEYSMTSGAGTGTAIFDTNISLATFGILEVFYRGNSNLAGTASYQQTGLYYIQVGTGFNGSAVAVQINQTEVFKHVPFGSPPALTFSSVIFDGSSESSSVTATAGCQIRIKISGYPSSYTGGGTQVMIRRIF